MTYLAMFLNLALKFKREVAILVLIALLCFAGVLYKGRGHKIDEIQAKHQIESITAQAEFEAKARQIEQSNYKGVIDAINQSEKRQRQIAVDIDTANATLSELHNITDTINTDLAKASRAATIDYTQSVSRLFESCTDRYLSMAENAAREQEEARRLRQAWPTN